MLYRHKKSGVVIDVESELRGEWEPLEPAEPEIGDAKPTMSTEKPAPAAAKTAAKTAKPAAKTAAKTTRK